MWLVADGLWTSHGMLPDGAMCIEEGRIKALTVREQVPSGAPVRALPGCVLFPGVVNAHSHAFQRIFRAQTEYVRPGFASEDFWSWRTQMYGAALRLGPEEVYEIAKRAYGEMLAAGYTCVGEFHYLHRDPQGRWYPEPEKLSSAVIEAALDVGIRIVLLEVLYRAGGIGVAATASQRRFVVEELGEYLAVVSRVRARYGDHPRVSVGLAPHSIRAVSVADLRALADWNRSHRLPVHMHVCEQVAEVAESWEKLGAGPLAVVEQAGLLNEHFVGVHATHLEDDDFARLADRGASVCACPTTEANLGDGFLPGLRLVEAGVPICIGSDSHIVINPWEELRAIENHARLQHRRRNVLAQALEVSRARRHPHHEVPTALRVAPGLLEMGCGVGARALGVEAGRLEVGLLADVVAVHREDRALQGVPLEQLPEAMVFCADTRAVAACWVGGEEVFTAPGMKAQP